MKYNPIILLQEDRYGAYVRSYYGRWWWDPSLAHLQKGNTQAIAPLAWERHFVPEYGCATGKAVPPGTHPCRDRGRTSAGDAKAGASHSRGKLFDRTRSTRHRVCGSIGGCCASEARPTGSHGNPDLGSLHSQS